MNDLVVKQLVGGQPSTEQRLKWAVDNFRFRVSQAADRLRTGKTTLPEFQQFGRDELKATYYMVAEIGKGAPLTRKEIYQVRRTLKEQVAYWDNFCQAIVDQRKALADKGLKGDELEDAFNNLYDKFDRRAQSYAGAIEAQGEQWAMAANEGSWYKWTLHPAEHCEDCLERDGLVAQVKNGRLPFYPKDGSTRCLYNCLCTWEPVSRFGALARQALGKLKQVVGRKSFDEIAEEWLEKGGPGSGWFGPPRGTHVSGAKAGGKVKTAKQMRTELIRNSKRQTARLKELRARGDKIAKRHGDLMADRASLFKQWKRAEKGSPEAKKLDAEIKDIDKETSGLWDKLVKNENEYWDLGRHMRNSAHEKLKVKTPAEFEVEYGKLRKGREELQGGANAFASLVGRGTLDGRTVTMHTTSGDRGYYDRDGVYLPPVNRKKAVVVHELGHWLEDKDPNIHARAVEFLERRTKGEKEVSLRGVTGNPSYRSWEVTKKNKFFDPYVGKQYRRTPGETPYATEVISMGIEALFKDPIGLASTDPEYFDLMYDLTRER